MVLPIEKFPSLILLRNVIMLQYIIIQCLFYYLSLQHPVDTAVSRKVVSQKRKSEASMSKVIMGKMVLHLIG